MFKDNPSQLHRHEDKPEGFFKKILKSVSKAVKSAVAYITYGFKLFIHKAAVFLHVSRKDSENRPSAVSSETHVIGSVKDPSVHAGKLKKKEKIQVVIPHISKEHLSGEGKEHITMFRPRRHKNGVVISVMLTSAKLILIAIFMIGAAGAGTIVGIAKAYMETTPTLDMEKIEDQSQTTYLYDMNGQEIATYTGVENRDWATIDEIPEKLQKAVIAIEDVRFEYHSGIDMKRLLGAFVSNLMNSNVQGGSTITQQLIKNRLLSPERTYKRKIQEAYLAMQLEETYNKEQILEAYLNTIHLGGSNYGVKTAAMDYFGKELNQLTLRECAMLAGITRYPYYYNPRTCYYKTNHPERVNDRTDNVLTQMYKAGFITKEEYDDALVESVHVEEKSKVAEMYKMPYFVEYAIYDVITHILKQRNMMDTKENRAQIDNEIRTNGYRIYTTVDPKIQTAVEQSLANWDRYPKLEYKEDSVKRITNDDGTVTEIIQPQAAAVVIEQSTGQLKAVVGGRTTPTARKTLNRAYDTSMPVGSSIKPIAVYAPAIDKGASDGTIVPNMPVKIEGWDDNGGKGYPSGGASKYGPVTLRTAVVRSLNSATAWTLLNLVKLDDSYNYLVDMGINPNHIQKTGSGLGLGASGITPIEMAGAYATIANMGVYLEPLSFTEVTDKDGNIILSADEIREQRKVFEPSTAWIVTDMLVNAVKSGTGTKAQIEGMTIGGKTGTNQEAKGVFFAGISPYYTATLWIGHDDFKPLDSDVYASSSAAPLWKDFMSKILEGKENKPIIDATPESLGLVSAKICQVSGKLATHDCALDELHPPQTAYFRKGTQPTENCDVHFSKNICQVSGKLATHNCPTETVVPKYYMFLPADSIYWKFTSNQRAKYMPNMATALGGGLSINDLEPSMPEYYTYYCDIHTDAWAAEQTMRANAVTNANAQISASNQLLSDPAYMLTSEDQLTLTNKIDELKTLLADAASTSGAIDQKTAELKQLTDMMIALYTPQPVTP